MTDDTTTATTNTTTGDIPRLMPSARAARMMGISPRTMQRLAASGAVPTVRTSAKGGARWVSIEALRRFVESGGVRVKVNAAPEIYC